MPVVRDDRTVEQKVADFLNNLHNNLPVRFMGETKARILAAATPAVVSYYLKGQ